MNYILKEKDWVTIFAQGASPFKVRKGDLKDGRVFDASIGTTFLRAWVTKGEIHVAHQFITPETSAVYIYNMPKGDSGKLYPKGVLRLHGYLLNGGGIPAVG